MIVTCASIIVDGVLQSSSVVAISSAPAELLFVVAFRCPESVTEWDTAKRAVVVVVVVVADCQYSSWPNATFSSSTGRSVGRYIRAME